MELGKDILEELSRRRAKVPKGVHSFAHEITLEVVEYIGEQRKFGMWLGITKRIGPGRMKDLLNQLREKNIRSPQYLMACTRKKTADGRLSGKHKKQ